MFFPTPLYNLASIHCDIQEFVHAHLSRASHSISISLTSGLDLLLFQPFFCVRDHCHCHHWSNWVRLKLSDRWHLTFDSRVFWYTQESMVDLMIARCTDPVAAKNPISSPFLTIVFDTWYVVFVLTCCAWFSLNVEHVWLHGQSSPLWISYFIGLFMWCLFPLLHHNGPSNLSHFFEHFCYLYFCRSTHIQRSCLINVIQKYDLYDDFTSRIGPIKPLCPPQLNSVNICQL